MTIRCDLLKTLQVGLSGAGLPFLNRRVRQLPVHFDRETRKRSFGIVNYCDLLAPPLCALLLLLTFLWHENVPSDNNAGERAIRPAVMIRKNSYANGSQRGAFTQSVLMTIFRTLKQRNIQPIDAILTALADYNQTGSLPAFPKTTSNG